MDGAATFTIVASRTSIVLAARTTAATSQRRSYDRALPARVEVVSMAFPSLIANDVCHEQCSSRTLYHRMDPSRRPRSTRDRPAKAPLSEEAIVDAALAILKAQGLEAVTMRRDAAALDTGPGSLYVYVSGR